MENFEIIVPTDKITLISGAKLYKDIPETLTYEYVVTEDEEILYSDKLTESNDVFNTLVKHKIKEDIKVEDLLIGDYNQILLALRISGYGNKYDIKFLNPDTNELENKTVDLSKIESKPLVEEFNENGEFSMLLETVGKNITFKLATVGLGDLINNVAKKRRGINGSTPFITTKLEYLITSVEGITDKQFISNFVKKLPPKDRLSFMKNIDRIEPNMILECDHYSYVTGETIKVPFTLGLNFFYPTE